MRTDPFTDSWLFLIGAQPDQEALGPWRYLFVVLFLALLVAGGAIAAVNWRSDAAQRTPLHAFTALFRLLLGMMWFQGSLWKMPFPVSGGLLYWTNQMAENAAFPFFGAIVKAVMLPNMALVDPLVFLAELGLAVSFILGVAVRPVAALGVLYVLGLWIGLYRVNAEWPWEYIFLIIGMFQFSLHAAGRALGLDAMLRRRGWPAWVT